MALLAAKLDSPSIFLSKVTKTANYSILTADEAKTIELGFTNAAARTFELPDEPADGFTVHILQNSFYTLTVKPESGSTDKVWTPMNGAGYGLDMPDMGTRISLRYDANGDIWDVVHKVGGRVKIERLVLYEPMDRWNLTDLNAAKPGRVADRTMRHAYSLYGNTYLDDESTSKFSSGCFVFDGSGDYFKYSDSADWDIFGDQTGHKTIALWIYSAAADDQFLAQYEDASNYWRFTRKADSTLEFQYRPNSVLAAEWIDMTGGTISNNTWTHVAFVLNGTEAGIYLDGVQVAYDTAWITDTFTGSLYVGQSGASANYWSGRMQELMIAYNNPFNATPNSTPDDTFTVPAAPLNLIM